MKIEEIKEKVFDVLAEGEAKTVYQIAFELDLCVPTTISYMKLLECGQYVQKHKSKSKGNVWIRTPQA